MEPEDLAHIYSNVLETVCKESPALRWQSIVKKKKKCLRRFFLLQ